MISEVKHCDNMEYMAQFGDNFFDLAIADPEYGIGESGGKSRRSKSKHMKKSWDSKPPNQEYFIELQRVSKNQIIWGGNYFTDKLKPTSCWLVWDKKLYNSDFSDFEMAWCSLNKGSKIFIYSKNGGNVDLMKVDIIHPTQKPIPLYDWCLKNYALPGYKIFDPNVGSGSSRISAYKNGFDFYGCELDKDYFDAQEKRFATHIAQQKLFTPTHSPAIQTTLL